MKNYDYVVQERQPEFDRDCLHRKLFSVNMRLFHASEWYHNQIRDLLRHLAWILQQKWEDYGSAPDGGKYGISGANLGIPYNVIGFWADKSVCDRTSWGACPDDKGRVPVVMINPVIEARSQEMVETKSNCGSIKFKEKIPVRRHRWVDVSWHDAKGTRHTKRFTGKTGGFTIQHEVDHNLGILITDRYLEQGGDPKLLETL